MKGIQFIQSRLSGIVITTLLIIGFALLVFLFIVVKNNETALTDRGFRNLKQHGLNINNRMANFREMANNNYEEDTLLRVVNIDSILSRKPNKKVDDYINFKVSEIRKGRVLPTTLFMGIESDDFFQGFLVFYQNKLVYKTVDMEIEVTQFQEFVDRWHESKKRTGYFFSSSSDTILNTNRYFKSGFVTEIEIGYIPYKAFIYPVITSPNDEKLYLCGLIKTEDFQKNKRMVETWVVVLFSLILLSILISFPIIKLFIINKFERINQSNLYYAGASIIFGTAVLSILALNFLSANYLHKNSMHRIELLNNQIKSNFKTELLQAYGLLKYFDDQDIQNSSIDVLDAPQMKPANLPSQYTFGKKNKTEPLYKYFKTVFWVDSTGQQLMEFKAWNYPVTLINIKNRDYVKYYNQWLLPGTNSNNCLFRIQSIYSNINGDALLALATPSHKKQIQSVKAPNKISADAQLIALSSPFYSLIETVVPEGFEFRVIDEKGKVWFHSNKNKNLQENLFNESDDNPELISSIASRIEHHFKLKIYNQKHYAYISPIDNLPLYLVTTENMRANIHQNAQITLSLLGYVLLIFLIGILFVLVMILIAYWKSNLRYRTFALDWILPKPKSHFAYMQLTLITILQITVLLPFLLLRQLNDFLYLKHVLVFCTTLFMLNVMVAYQMLNLRAKNLKQLVASPLMLISFSSVFVLNAVIIDSSYLFPLSIIAFLILLIILCSRLLTKDMLINRFKASGYLDAYRNYIFSFLLLVSLLIPILLFKSFFIETSQIKLKHQQRYITSKIEQKNESINQYYLTNFNVKNTAVASVMSSRKKLGNYISEYQNTRILSEKEYANISVGEQPKWLTVYFYLLDKLLTFNRIGYPEFNRSRTADRKWCWSKQDSTLVYSQLVRQSDNLDQPTFDTIKIASNLPLYSPIDLMNCTTFNIDNKKSHPFKWAFIWCCWVALALCFLNYLLKVLLNRVFYSGKTYDNQRYTIDNAIEYLTKNKLNSNLVNLLEHEAIIQHLKKNESIQILDAQLDIQANGFNSDKQVLIKLGFSDEPKIFLKELEMLDKLRQNDSLTIIVFSKISISQFIKKLNQQNSQLKDDDYEGKKNLAELINKFESVMSTFVTLFVDSNSTEDILGIENQLNHALLNEIQVSKHLLNLKPALIDFQNNHPNMSSDVYILKVNNLAHSYYQYLWSCCTLEEKFILFDLANDSVANAQNREELEALIGKRLIHAENGLHIMNVSFANFILEYPVKDQMVAIEMQAKRKGGWEKFKIPLILIASFIGVFIIITQQSFVTKISAVVVSVGSLVGLFSRFGGIFKNGSE